MMSIPWHASAALVRPGGMATEVGTLLGCVRAWQALKPGAQGDVHILCREPVFHASWKDATRQVGPARIPQLFAML